MKRILSSVLSIILIAALLSTCAFVSFAKDVGGSCGDDLTWSYNSSTKTLTITGTGAMYDYNNISVPWAAYQGEIKTAIIEDGVTSLGTCALCYCSVLTSVAIPDSVKSIGNYAFHNSSKLSSIFFTGTYKDLSGITVSKNNNPLTRAKFYSPNGKCGNRLRYSYAPDTHVLTITGNGDMYDYNSASSPWYSYRSEINSIVIEENVTSIGAFAFFDCYAAGSVSIPESTERIGKSAFYGCDALWSITIPEAVTKIESDTFGSCTGLNRIVLPDSLKEIGEYAFCGDVFSDFEIPDSVEVIGEGAFAECYNLRDITIPYGVEIIEDYLFYNCTSLQSIAIPGSVKTVDEYAFTACMLLSDVYFIGTETEWKNVDLNIRGNLDLESANIHYFTRCRAYGHDYVEGVCSICGSTDPHYIGPVTLPGDADGDGEVSVKDLKLFKKYLIGTVDLSEIVFRNADVNSDGDITITDSKAVKALLINSSAN